MNKKEKTAIGVLVVIAIGIFLSYATQPGQQAGTINSGQAGVFKDPNFQRFNRPFLYNWQDVSLEGSTVCVPKKGKNLEYSVALVNSGSMSPMIVGGETLLIQKNFTKQELRVGDVVFFSYSKDGAVRTGMHRIVRIGEDQNGWFATTFGDNNLYEDPKIRFEDITAKLVGVLY